MNWYLAVLQNYAGFGGRARRQEYWYFVLFNLIIGIVLGIIDGVAGSQIGDSSVGLLGAVYNLGIFIPSIAVAMRRLHDTGRSGWWLLIGIVPLIGWLVLLFFMVQDSQPGGNQYGPNPKRDGYR